MKTNYVYILFYRMRKQNHQLGSGVLGESSREKGVLASSSLSVDMHQRGSKWADFSEILYWGP
jgi:hypothetical protein